LVRATREPRNVEASCWQVQSVEGRVFKVNTCTGKTVELPNAKEALGPLTCAQAIDVTSREGCENGSAGIGCSAKIYCNGVETNGDKARAQLVVELKSGPFMYRKEAWPEFVRRGDAWVFDGIPNGPLQILKPPATATADCSNYRLRISKSDGG